MRPILLAILLCASAALAAGQNAPPVHEMESPIDSLLEVDLGVHPFPGWSELSVLSPYMIQLGETCDTSAASLPKEGHRDSVRAWGRVGVAVNVPRTMLILFWYQLPPELPRELARLTILVVDARGNVVDHVREGAASGEASLSWPFSRGKPRQIAPGAFRVRFLAARDSVEFPFCVHALDKWPHEVLLDSPIESTPGRQRR